MNDKNEQAGSQQSESDLQACCDGGSCCPSGSDGGNKSWKIVVFILIVVAAGAVLARSIVRKSDASAEQGQDTFAAIQPVGIQDASQPKAEAKTQDPTAAKGNAETPVVANEKTEKDVPDKASPALWGPELDSLASLNKAAANSDAVFILLAADDQESNHAATKQIEAAAKKIQSNGVRISAFRLSQGAPNYANFSKQLSTPCVLAMVKGGGVSGVSADQIAETKLVQAFVTASRPSAGCCPPGSGVTCP